MNWKLTLLLSLFGLVMGFASIFGWIQGLEPFLWPLIGITCAIWIAKKASARHFLNGFMVGLIGGDVAPLIQALFFNTYLANSPDFIESLRRLPAGLSPTRSDYYPDQRWPAWFPGMARSQDHSPACHVQPLIAR